MSTKTRILSVIGAVLATLTLAGAASAGSSSPSPVQRIIAQETGRHGDLRIFGSLTAGADNEDRLGDPRILGRYSPAAEPGQSPVERILAQEEGRHGDPRILGRYGPGAAAPVAVPVVKFESGGFDWGDAGVGSAAMLALVLLLAGGAALLQTTRRERAHG